MLNKPILSTKLTPPRSFQTYFERKRLVKLLEANKTKIATFLIGGAGYGKSTLASQWVKNKTSIWVSCDADMNDIESLLSYIVYAFIKNNLNLFPQTSILLSGQNKINKELLINTFFTEVNTTTKHTYLVLDDFHLLNSPQITELLELYLKYPPKNIHLILITRHDPVLNFSKHRLNSVFHEIRMHHLNLTKTELKDYAKECFDLDLNKEQLTILMDKTEGWFLGVTQLLSLCSELNTPIIRHNSSAHSDQFNKYFSEEVIRHQSENSQKVLFICSLFYQFNEDLITYILVKIEPDFPMSEILGTLRNKTNFTIALDHSNQWLRFHHQFQEALLQYFKNHEYSNLRLRCLQFGGEWLMENGYYEDGIIKTLESGKHTLAIEQLHKIRYKLLNSDQYTRLRNLLVLFPDEIRNNNVELLLIKIILLENQLKHEALAESLKKLQLISTESKLSNQQLSETKVMQAVLLFYSGEYGECIRYIDKALTLLEPYAVSLTTFAYAYKAFALNALNKGDEAIEMLKIRLDAFHPSEHQNIVRTMTTKALVYAFHSDLNSIQSIVPRIIEISDKHRYYETLGMGLYLQLDIKYRRGEHNDLSELFKRSFSIRHLMRPVWYIYLAGIQVLISLKSKGKNLQKALHYLDSFCNELHAENITQLKNALLIEVALAQQNYEEALRLHAQTNYHLHFPIHYYFLPQVTELKLLLYTRSDNNLDEFFNASKNLWIYAKEMSHQNLLLKLNILHAEAALIQGDKKEALSKMKNALKISRTTLDLTVYTEFSNRVYEILKLIPKTSSFYLSANHILSFFNVYPIKPKPGELAFKDRDVKILKLVSSGHTNAQIADTLFLSTESVKKYLYDIFQNLGVKNRMNAVIKAKEIGVIQ
jgi:LuxR family maltose regulon positive regulatory protein